MIYTEEPMSWEFGHRWGWPQTSAEREIERERERANGLRVANTRPLCPAERNKERKKERKKERERERGRAGLWPEGRANRPLCPAASKRERERARERVCLGVSLPLSLCVCVCARKLGQQIGRTLATSVMDCDSQSRALSIRQPSFLVQKSCAAPWSTVCRARAFCILPCQSEAYPCGRAGHAAHQHDQAAPSLP